MSPFIVIEGLDGAGTTTQVTAVAAALRAAGASVHTTHEPTDGPVGRIIRRTLASDPDAPSVETLPWLFAADRADHIHRTVTPKRLAGSWVLSDRYSPSSLAYQSLTLPLPEVAALNALFPVPDLLVFVHVPVATCVARIEARAEAREIYERSDRLETIAAAYERVLALLSSRGDPVARVDGTSSPTQVTQAIVAAVTRRIGWPSSSNSKA